MNREMKKIKIVKINPLRVELIHNKEAMTDVKFREYIKEKRRMSRMIFDDLSDMDIKYRKMYLRMLDLSDLFIRVRYDKVFYDESELNRLR